MTKVYTPNELMFDAWMVPGDDENDPGFAEVLVKPRDREDDSFIGNFNTEGLPDYFKEAKCDGEGLWQIGNDRKSEDIALDLVNAGLASIGPVEAVLKHNYVNPEAGNDEADESDGGEESDQQLPDRIVLPGGITVMRIPAYAIKNNETGDVYYTDDPSKTIAEIEEEALAEEDDDEDDSDMYKPEDLKFDVAMANDPMGSGKQTLQVFVTTKDTSVPPADDLRSHNVKDLPFYFGREVAECHWSLPANIVMSKVFDDMRAAGFTHEPMEDAFDHS